VLIGAFALLLLITNFRRHLAQESLRASEDKFSKAFRSSPLFISITTQAEGRYIEVNEAFERGIGYGRAEVIGRTSREIGLWRHSEDRERAVALLMKSGKISQFEVQVRNKSGEWMMCELWGEPITIGGERCVIWVAYDISARKKVELEILQLNKSLEQRVRERTAELEALTVRLGETNARLEETNAEQEAFVYSISHDFKAPIRAISGFASLLRERKTLRSEEESTQYLDRILTNAKRMGGLLEDLLDLSRYSTQEFNKKAFDMQAKVGSIISELAGEASGVKFEVGELPQATGDPILVRQVWINLISNAIKYSSKASEPVVRIGFENGRYFVADNGAGFDMAYAEKLFKLFSRLHTDAEYSGTGVGLAIVKRIVERHGGQVEATGTVGWGARFSFTLPN
jgi:PAS domain S-box-containing protein